MYDRFAFQTNSRLIALALGLCLVSASVAACSDNGGENGTSGDTGPADTSVDGTDTGELDVDASDASQPTASVQLIYEVPEPAASEVDLFINGELFADNIQFRTATSFREVPANEELNFEVATPDAASAEGTDTTLDPGEATFGDPLSVTLDPESSNQIVLHGVANTQDYSVGDLDVDRDIGLSFAINRNAREEPTNVEGETEINAVHASFDTPAVDVVADNQDAAAIEQLDYGAFNAGYLSLQEGRHLFDLTAVDDIDEVIRTFQTDLFESANVLTLVASGFSSDENASGANPGFSIVAYETEDTDEDGFIQGQSLSAAARVQFIHASPDAELSSVDVYFNGQRRFDEFAYRDATPFFTIRAGTTIEIDVTEPAAPDNDEPIVDSQQFTFQPGSTQVLAANGVVDPSDWEGDFGPLSFAFRRGAAVRSVPEVDDSSDGSQQPTAQAALQILHGSNDADTLRPELTVMESDQPRRLPALEYTQYLSDVRGNGLPVFVRAYDRTLTIRNDTGTAIGSAYNLPLSEEAYVGNQTTLVMTGVLTANGDPADAVPFDVFLVTQAGETVQPVPAN